VTATTAVQVVTETRQGWLTMPDLRTFVRVWDAAVDTMAAGDARSVAVEPVVMTEGQGGRLRKITAALPERVIPS
jgi:hypothetical protein